MNNNGRKTNGGVRAVQSAAFVIIASAVCVLSARFIENRQAAPDGTAASGAAKIFITSDPHYFSRSLYDDSETFRAFMEGGDGKIIDYSDTIARAFANDVINERPSAVIISGDLTLNGEKESHTDFAEILREIKDAGIRVLVTPGNHDINNPYARKITNGGVSRTNHVTPQEFVRIYGEFGYYGALTSDKYSLSYLSDLGGGVYALMLDTCMYNSNIENNTSFTGGRVQAETAEWMREAVQTARDRDPDAVILTAMHHNLFVHNRNFEFNYVVYSADRLVKEFEALELGLVFSGHIHIQDILTKNTNERPITEIVGSSLVVYPVSYGVAEISGDTLNYYTQPVDMAAYAQAAGSDDKNLLEFEQYARLRFTERSGRRIEQALMDMNYSDADVEEAVNAVKKINAYYFAGKIGLVSDEILSSRGYAILTENNLTNAYLESVFEDGEGENNSITLKLR